MLGSNNLANIYFMSVTGKSRYLENKLHTFQWNIPSSRSNKLYLSQVHILIGQHTTYSRWPKLCEACYQQYVLSLIYSSWFLCINHSINCIRGHSAGVKALSSIMAFCCMFSTSLWGKKAKVEISKSIIYKLYTEIGHITPSFCLKDLIRSPFT